MSDVLDLSEPGPDLPELAVAASRRHRRAPRWGWQRVARLAKPVGILCAARLATLAVLDLARGLTHQSPILVARWDVGWYLQAARYGWPHSIPTHNGHAAQSTLGFFPAFPLLIRGVHAAVPLGWAGSGELAVSITEVAMVIAFWYLARDVWGEQAADRATVLLCFFPGAYVLALTYTEPLLLAASCACILALRRRRWILAGLLGALATFTHPNAIVLVPCCAWESFLAIRSRKEWLSLVSVVLAPAGILAWFGYLDATTGSFTAWFRTEQQGWQEHSSALAPVHLVEDVVRQGFAHPNVYVPLLGAALALVLLVVLLTSRPPGVFVIYTVCLLALSVVSTVHGLLPRYVLTAFPLVMALGYRLKGSAYGLAVGVSATLMTGLLLDIVATKNLVP